MAGKANTLPLARGDTNIHLNALTWGCRGAPQLKQENADGSGKNDDFVRAQEPFCYLGKTEVECYIVRKPE